MEYEEGGDCPCCDGKFEIYSERGCTCFIVAPCSSCVDSVLKCDKCGLETDRGWMIDPLDLQDNMHGQRVMEFA